MQSVKSKVMQRVSTLARFTLLILGVAALRAQAAGLSVSEIREDLATYSVRILAVSVFLTAGSFFLLSGMELFALNQVGRSTGKKISRRRGAITGFIAHAFSQVLGLSVITGPAVRLRAYGQKDISVGEVARVSAFVTVTVTLGLLAGGATAMLLASDSVSFHGYVVHLHIIGLVLASLLSAYVVWCFVPGSRRIGLKKWKLARPSGPIAAAQIAIATADWMLAGSVLFVLLPRGMFTYPHFLPAYFVAQSAAVLSHVPGGVGVFEAALFGLLGLAAGGANAGASMIAAFVAYRVIYYLVPLTGAACVALVAGVRAKSLAPAVVDR